MTTAKRFQGPKYCTARVAAALPLSLQLFIWTLIEQVGSDSELDYLQVFNLDTSQDGSGTIQLMVHSQEVPAYSKQYAIPSQTTLKAKVYVIDDGAYSTMLFAEEY
ncbi:MAG: hypothetical protein FD169_1836 [Bacillota bacterium]|nr:MAG: hypothetical protein FD169_1836 [Bacillota bacterium]